MRTRWDIPSKRSPAEAAAQRLFLERRRARPPRHAGRYLRINWWVVLPGLYIAGMIHPRVATSADVFLAAIVILLACEAVFIPGWLRPSTWWRVAGELLGGLGAGPAGRWRHLVCRLRGHVDGEEYFTCAKCGRIEPGAAVEVDEDALAHARLDCGAVVTYTPAPTSCTVCGDPLLPNPGGE